MTTPETPTPIANKVFALVLGVIFVLFGIGNAWLTARVPAHSDKELLASMGVAIFGALLISPTLVAGAIKTLVDACRKPLANTEG